MSYYSRNYRFINFLLLVFGIIFLFSCVLFYKGYIDVPFITDNNKTEEKTTVKNKEK
ncbi:hypothetical protein AshY1_02080 [Candidatus Phytoplasma fraxini]|uniref:Lipoprotein n=1 Tax=Ash yellows phytoplasma TaxID=35780 RepID=A0ABZ2U8N7_ASHYP